MNDLEQRLIRSFQIIFPNLDDKRVRHASNTSLPAWDSMATITLVNVVEEEFGIQIDIEAAPELTSFDRFLVYMRGRANRGQV